MEISQLIELLHHHLHPRKISQSRNDHNGNKLLLYR
jgi:hypothetical protein